MSVTISRLQAVNATMAVLDCDYGVFSLQADDLYELNEEENEWEPVDWDIVAEDAKLEADYVELSEALQNCLDGYNSVK